MPAESPSRTSTSFDGFVRIWRMILAPVGSLKITVALFVLSSLLVFFGTLAQKGQGVWTVVDNYFYSWFVQVDVKYLLEFGKVFLGVSPEATTELSFPFPAGKLLGVLMVINLTAAYARNFPSDLNSVIKQSRKGAGSGKSAFGSVALYFLKRTGVYLLHGGVLLLLVGEYVTREYAVEQQMLIPEGGSSNYAYETRNFELAFVDSTDPNTDKVAVLPGKKMKAAVEARDEALKYNLPAPSTRFSNNALPVDVEVLTYYPNSNIIPIVSTIQEAVRNAVPEDLRASLGNAPDQVVTDAAALLSAFDKAREEKPNDPPLPLFENVLAEQSQTKFQGKVGEATVDRIRAGVAELKGKQQATTGLGMEYIATSEPEVSGVDTSQKMDLPSAYVNLFDNQSGNSLGIYLVSAELSFLRELPAQEVPGQAARMELRPTRHYKAYTLHLKDFKFDRYVGTETAKNYSSDLRLEDPGLNQNRDVTIRMNEPLRHRGDAIFQSSFTPDEKATILQVVSNPGWTIPYVSCVLVGLGMLVHFCLKMGGFVARSMKGVNSTSTATATTPRLSGIDMTGRSLPPFARYGVPAIAAALAVLTLLGLSMPRKPKKDRLDLQQLATLPVADGGRVKPLDTVARVRLRQISHTEEVTAGEKKLQAIQWLMDLYDSTPGDPSGPGAWRIFRIENDEVRSLLKLERREGLRYSADEITVTMQTFLDLNALPEDVQQTLIARGVQQRFLDPDKLPAEVKQELARRNIEPTVRELPVARPEFREFMDESRKAYEQRQADSKSLGVYQSKLIELADHLRIHQELSQEESPLILPPGDETEWSAVGDARQQQDVEMRDRLQRVRPALQQRMAEEGLPQDVEALTPEQQKVALRILSEELDKAAPEKARLLEAWDKVLSAYKANDPKAFDEAVGEYRKMVAERVPATAFQRANLETYLNQSSMFFWCTGLYVFAAVASLIGFVLLVIAPKASQTIRRGVFWWLVVVFLGHTFTLLARMYLMDRPLVFVTNLYSSAVFIGWGVMALCLILELMFPIGFGNLVASVLGFATAIIAHNLATSGDTLEMMQAVLDTNFWLATHVTTVTLGYAATYVAGVLGLLYVAVYVLPEKAVLRQKVVIGSGIHQLNYDIGKILGTLTYAVVCFAALLSFVGTVLGGIWADQSWGRFWGWDPKENGAVLIVLWNALILHARWGGMVKERGIAVLSIVGIIITTWSWFGTNQLGVGLHAYGFSNQLVRLCDWVWGGALFALLVGVLPWQWVYRGGTPTSPPKAERV